MSNDIAMNVLTVEDVLSPFDGFTPGTLGDVNEVATRIHAPNDDDKVKALLDAPLTVARRFVNVHGHTVAYELRWLDVTDRTPRSDRFPLHDLRNETRLKRHTGVLPITSREAEYVLEYLKEQVKCNLGLMPRTVAVDQLGWCGSTFVVCETRDVALVGRLLQGEAGQVARAVCAERAGTLEGWVDVIRRYLTEQPRAQLPIAAAFAAPLVGRLGRPGFMLDLQGVTSTGKTTLQQAGVSTVGHPGAPGQANPTLVPTWNATLNGLVDRLEACNGFPTFIDERSVAQDPGLPAKVVYMVGGGRGRTRSSVDRDREAAVFSTVVISTGEGPITVGAGGKAGRLVVERTPLIVADTPEEAEALMRGLVTDLADHHGHAMEHFVKHLAAEPVDGVRATLDSWATTLRERATNDLGRRRAPHVAALALAHQYAHAWKLLPDPPGESYNNLVREDVERDDPARLALELLLGAIESDLSSTTAAATLPDGRVAIERGWAQRALGRLGEVLDEHLPTWKERGWTDCQRGRLTRYERVVGRSGSPVPCVVVRGDVVRELFEATTVGDNVEV